MTPARTYSVHADTSAAAHQLQVRLWQGMDAEEKLHLIADQCDAVSALARAGIRSRHPHADSRGLLLRFAVLTLGRELASRAYTDVLRLSE